MSTEVRHEARKVASYLVKAPAGSGKTELLIQRILVLLAEVDEPERILALTFTRKAAAEMRTRVIKALTMEKPDDKSSHEMETWRLANRALAQSNERGWNLIEHPARLRIMTLDSFSHTLARQMPLLSGLGDMPTPTENAQAAYREAAEAALNEAMQAFPEAAESVLLHQDHNTVAVRGLIAEMLGRRDQWLKDVADHARDMAGLKKLLESNLEAIMRQQVADCDALMPADAKSALPVLLSFAGENRGDALLASLATWPDASLVMLEQWQVIAREVLTDKEAVFRKPRGINVKRGFPAGREFSAQKEQFQQVLESLADVPGLAEALHGLRGLPGTAVIDAAQWQVMESLFLLLILANAHLKHVFSQRRETDFVEIALRSLDTMGGEQSPSDLLLRLDNQIQHILVDEFQDTSKLQINLLRCLTAGWQGDGRTLFMVGDPMQSIYRFRKAEVELFLQAAMNRAGLPDVEVLNLERNFRSAPVIVGWVNRAFRHIFPNEPDILRGAVEYTQADAALSHAGCVHLHLQSGRDDALEAETIVRLVREELAKPSCDGGAQRIGILARSRSHLHAVMPALSKAGIPFRAIKVLPLHTRPEVRTLRALMRALLHPADRLSWAALLRAPCCGLNTAEMYGLLGDDARSVWSIIRDEDVLEGLNADACSRITHIVQALGPCMQMSGRVDVRKLVSSAWLRLGMPSLIDETCDLNVEAAFDLIGELDEGGYVDFALFDERAGKLFAAPDVSPEASRLELLTMHGAKGLQWDVVILPGLGRTTGKTDAPLLAFTEAPVPGAPPLISPKAATRSRDALYDMIQGIEKNKADNELARLLYVSCTRAETALHMFGHASEKSGAAVKGSLLALLMQHDEGCFGADIEMLEKSDREVANMRLPLHRIRNLPALLPEIEAEDIGLEPEYAWAGPEAAPIGNAVHAALQQMAEKGIENWNEGDTVKAALRMRRILMGEGLSGDLLEAAARRCERGLKLALGSDRGRWLLSGKHEEAHSEWVLSFRDAGGQVRQNVIDRSFVYKGERWIIDYKTASHEGGDIEAFLDRERERHADQLIRYAKVMHGFENQPVRMGLYFPMLDGWREVNAG